MNNLKIVTKPVKQISDGFCVSNDAYLVISHNIPSLFQKMLIHYMNVGMIKIETARLKPKEI